MRNMTEKNGTETEDANCGIKNHPLLVDLPKRIKWKKRKNKQINSGIKATNRDVIAIWSIPRCWERKMWVRKWAKLMSMTEQGVYNIINEK